MMTLIGSRAMKHWFPDAREPKGDWDYQAPRPELTDLATLSPPGEYVDVFYDERLESWPWGRVATPDELYTMKISHGYWDINGTWDKHAADIVFLQRKGAKFIPELHDLLLEIWKDRYKKNPISLDKTAEAFFGDHVVKKYVHDTVHESVAYRHRPWYLEYLKDGSEVLVDNAKFWALPLEDQLQALREEFYVIALERVLIPRNYVGSPTAAYRWALRRSAISLFKNRWATFILLHLDELSRPDVDYVSRHKSNSHMLVEVLCTHQTRSPGQLKPTMGKTRGTTLPSGSLPGLARATGESSMSIRTTDCCLTSTGRSSTLSTWVGSPPRKAGARGFTSSSRSASSTS